MWLMNEFKDPIIRCGMWSFARTVRARLTIQGRQRQTNLFGICDMTHSTSIKYANSIATSSQPIKKKISGSAMPISILTSPINESVGE